MDSFPKGSISRGSLSKFFKRVGSDFNQTPNESGNGARSLRSLFTRDSSITRKYPSERNCPANHSLSSSSSSSESPDTITTPTSPPTSPDIPVPLVSVWESDTEDEEERNSFRARIRTRMSRFKKNKRLPLPLMESDSKPEPEAPPPPPPPPPPPLPVRRGPRELRVVPGTHIPSRVFGRNIPYEITGQRETTPTGTFSHFRKLPRNYSPPAGNEVLHVREKGYEYLTLERFNGVTSITAGTLQCLGAELAYPLFAKNDSAQFFENLIFCGSMLFGNAKLLELLLSQLKNCVGKPEQQLNIIHFLMHWMEEKPEDFSWREDILELRHKVFRYLLAMLRQTELATKLWKLSVKHEELERSYKQFVNKQKRHWVSFDDIVTAYARRTNCSLVDEGLSNVDVDDLTHYLAAVDLLLFRDGSEMSTLDEFWGECVKPSTSHRPRANQRSATERPQWLSAADRVKRLIIRMEMIRHWVSLEILQLSTFEARTRMIQTFITVADNLLEMGDLHGAYCIMQGLESPLVRQLQQCWEEIGIRCLHQCTKLREFLHERTIYDTYLKKPSQDPVIPYYDHFLEEVTALYKEKDHSSRTKSTGTTRLHKDVTLNEFGDWDTFENRPYRPVSSDGISQLSTSVDLKKYRNLLTALNCHRERAKPDYWFAGEITRESFVLKLHVIGVNGFASLGDLENSAAAGHKGRLNFMSRLVETRILEAWSLVPNTYIPPTFCDGEVMRTVLLQKLHLATKE